MNALKQKLHKKLISSFFFWFVSSGIDLPATLNYERGRKKSINNSRVKIKEIFKQSTL